MIILYSLVALALAVSFVANKGKTLLALKTAFVKFFRLVPPFLVMTGLTGIALTLVPQSLLMKVLGEGNLAAGIVGASVAGSVAFIPGFIVFPLCGLLREQGVSYAVLSAFSTTLMMVGILSYPLERDFMGRSLAILRNAGGFLMAIVVALVTGLVFGEIHL